MDDRPEIVVVGEASAAGVPDHCQLALSLHMAAETAPDALSGVAALADQVIAVLHQAGIAAVDIQTGDLTLQDVFDREKNRVTGRVASYALNVTVPGLERTGPLLAEVAPVAGDALQIRHIQLAVADLRPLLAQARRAAVTDALERAAQLAEAAGVRTGAIVAVEELDHARSGPGRSFARLSAAPGATPTVPVEAGTSTVVVRVRLRVALED